MALAAEERREKGTREREQEDRERGPLEPQMRELSAELPPEPTPEPQPRGVDRPGSGGPAGVTWST